MELKHFFIAGAQRSGTTYLYHLCAEHPQIEMAQPVKPEPKFFMTDSLYERGLEYYKSAYFKGKPGALILGEKSTSYIEVEKAAQRISQHFPDGKIIFILRNPVERVISNYWFSVKNGFEKLPIEEAFLKEEERRQSYDTSKVSVSPYAYLGRGRYIEYIEMYERYFSAGQIYIILHEQIINSGQTLRDFYAYLGVDPAFVPASLHTVINANENKPDKNIDPQLRKYLENYFVESNARLSKRLGISLAEWQ
ncbi:MAG: sulfotransferase [Chloroflexi bacterium]|nr:MAG: sulfotransferase [Chloroflexota bacterium]